MKILVVGAGAIGSVFATALARADAEVTLLVRTNDVPPAGSVRLSVEDDHETEQRWAIIPVVSEVSEAPDLVILAVKTHNVTEAAQTIAPHIGNAPVLTTQIGPRGDVLAGAVLGTERIISCVPWFAATLREPGHARITGDGHLYLGVPQVTEGYTHATTSPATIAALIAALTQTLPTTQVTDIVGRRWTRLLLCMPQALSASTNTPIAALLQDRRLTALSLTLIREATRVLESAGIDLAPLPGVTVDKVRRLHTMPSIFAARALRQQPLLFTAYEGMSNPTLQSLQRGRPSEIDYLNGEIVRLGIEHGVPTPANTRIVELIHTIEQSGSFLTLDALAKATSRL